MALASEKQISFIRSLMGDRQIPATWIHVTDADVPNLTRPDASEMIGALLSAPKVNVTPSKVATLKVPSGRYAIVDDEGVVKFYRVNCPTEGRWAGYTFVEAVASDDTYPIRNLDKRVAILSAILADGVENALRRYGHEIGSCGVCGRTLTDADSRKRGIGPICEERMGF